MFFHIRCFDSRRLNLNNAFIVCVIWSMEIFELNTLDFRILLCSVAIERGIFNPRMFMRVVNTLHVVLVAWIPILKRGEDLSETDYCLYTIVWFNFLVDEEIMQLIIDHTYLNAQEQRPIWLDGAYSMLFFVANANLIMKNRIISH
jgi:hypothetical protein